VAAIRNRPVLYVAGLAVATAIAAVASWRAARWPNLTALAISALLLVLGGYYNFVFARLPAATPTLRVGEMAPDFTLPDAAGRPVALSSFRDRTPVVLVFYRGSW
jgi:cytochrome oxidase Cu insertion factor (SCO1/SenC/PrrC family)